MVRGSILAVVVCVSVLVPVAADETGFFLEAVFN